MFGLTIITTKRWKVLMAERESIRNDADRLTHTIDDLGRCLAERKGENKAMKARIRELSKQVTKLKKEIWQYTGKSNSGL